MQKSTKHTTHKLVLEITVVFSSEGEQKEHRGRIEGTGGNDKDVKVK